MEQFGAIQIENAFKKRRSIFLHPLFDSQESPAILPSEFPTGLPLVPSGGISHRSSESGLQNKEKKVVFDGSTLIFTNYILFF